MAVLLILVIILTYALHRLLLSLLFWTLTLSHGPVNMYVICIVIELYLTFSLNYSAGATGNLHSLGLSWVLQVLAAYPTNGGEGPGTSNSCLLRGLARCTFTAGKAIGCWAAATWFMVFISSCCNQCSENKLMMDLCIYQYTSTQLYPATIYMQAND
jgi:hypothetical protein